MTENSIIAFPVNNQSRLKHLLGTLSTVVSAVTRASAGAYGISISGLLILRVVLGVDNWRFIAPFNDFLHVLMFPALILLPIFLVWRKWTVVVTLIIPVIALGGWFAPRFLPKNTVVVPESAQTFTIVTYNLHSERLRAELMIPNIREVDADFVALQEVSTVMADVIESELIEQYPYQVLFRQENSVHGQGFLSKYPILEEESWRAVLAHQRVLVEVNGTPIVIYNIHMSYPFPNNFARRADDVEAILARATMETYPVILAGDFNLTEFSADYQMIREHFNDAFLEVGQGLGLTYSPIRYKVREYIPFMPIFPMARIDYIFYDDTVFTAISADVMPDDGLSDHRRVLATFAF